MEGRAYGGVMSDEIIIGGWHIGATPEAGSQVVTWLSEQDSVSVGPADAGDTDGLQVWAPAPDAGEKHTFAPEPLHIGDHEVALIVGQIGWDDSPVQTTRPLLLAEIRFGSHDALVLDADPGFEYAWVRGADEVDFSGDAGHLTLKATDATMAHVVRAVIAGGPSI